MWQVICRLSLQLVSLTLLCSPLQTFGMSIAFVQFHERLDNFRRFPMNGNVHSFGVDINSTVEIDFDPSAILGDALSPEARLLAEYTEALRGVRFSLERYTHDLSQILSRYNQGDEMRRTQIIDGLRPLISHQATAVSGLIDILLKDSGISKQAKEDALGESEQDYHSLTELIVKRISQLRATILANAASAYTTSDTGLRLDVFCLHIAVTGAADTIHLPNYDRRLAGGVTMAQHINVGSLETQTVVSAEREIQALAQFYPEGASLNKETQTLAADTTQASKVASAVLAKTGAIAKAAGQIAQDEVPAIGTAQPADLPPPTSIQIPRTTRQENDIYELHVAIIRHTNQDATILYSDEYDFRIGYYGWRTTTTGALAFTLSAENGGTNKFSPATCGSVLFHYRRRPDAARIDHGGGGILGDLIDLGLGFHAIIFDQSEQIQYGIGGSLTFFHDILHFGAGFNLQRSHRAGYVLVGIKLLEIRDKGGKVEPPVGPQ